MKLSSSEWVQLSGLLDEALNLPAEQRAAWLTALSGTPPELRQTLYDLLSDPGKFETADLLSTLPKFIDSHAQDATQQGYLCAGGTVGAYRLIREIGRGGMGTVWLAERHDDLIKRSVALKLPHPGVYNSQLADRLARERDILAGLSHVNIARLYDAGIAANGQPYLALEYVAGVSVIEYCDTQRLSVHARLTLFMQILNAVQYAHERHVIHRDLKPSNILVTPDGLVQLLDFGVAKLITEGEAKETQLTQLGGRVMTPDYASPEQIAGQPIGSTSDVYALGVILFEMLTGERPYRLKRGSRGALEEAILAAEPQKPSLVAVRQGSMTARGASAKVLRTLLNGDLDNITLKALKKSPSERYRSAQDFAEDIRRYFSGEPITARADSKLYRWGKFARRNKLVLGSVSLVTAGLCIGLVLSLQQASRAREQARTAQREAKRAKAVQAFLLDIFQANTHLQENPLKARQTTARELLDIGVERIEASLSEEPEAQEELLGTLADMYTQMGLDGQAAALRLRRIETLKKLYGSKDAHIVDALLDYTQDISGTPERHKTPAVLAQAQAILDQTGDFTSPTRAALWMEYARWNRYVAPRVMRDYADRAVALLQHSREDWIFPLSLQLAAIARAQDGDYPAAEQKYVETLAAIHHLQPKSSAWEISPLAELGDDQRQLFNMKAAEENLRASLGLSFKLNGDNHVETLFSSSRLGYFLAATSRYKEGLELLERTAAAVDRDPKLQDQSVAGVVYGRYGEMLYNTGRFEMAERYLSLDVQEARSSYPDSIPLAKALLHQGLVFMAMGRDESADQALSQSVGIAERCKTAGMNPRLQVPYLLARGELEVSRNEVASALRTSQQIQALGGEPVSPEGIRATLLVADIRLAEGDLAKASSAAQLVFDRLQGAPWRDYFTTLEADVQRTLGRTRLLGGDFANAVEPLRRAEALRAASGAPDSPWLAQTQLDLAECMWMVGQRNRARALLTTVRVNLASHAELGRQFTAHLQHLLHLTAAKRHAATSELFASPGAPSDDSPPGIAQSVLP
jgi:serine/threonine protein kinase